jgi:hypothetical protein
MLSRSNSNAGDRLRRAKSTSSHHTSSSGHQRTSTSIDPFVTRQQAEVAAVEAYIRAKQLDDWGYQTTRPVPQKLQRRRSQNTGRTEGSHLQDARLGRRRSTSRKGDGRAPQPVRVREREPTVAESFADSSAGEERIITKKRSVIPPSSSVSRQTYSDHLSVPPPSHRFRKAQSVYADGSPTPRHAPSLNQRSSTLQLSTVTSDPEHSDGYGGNFEQLSNFAEPTQDFASSTPEVKQRSIRETQTNDDILAMARDKYLQDFQQKKVKQRKSMFFAPLQKLRSTTPAVPQRDEKNFDTGLPPFNYADDGELTLLQAAAMDPATVGSAAAAPPLPAIAVDKRRNFSSVKNRIKNVFRKTSSVRQHMPPQQVQATHYHYGGPDEAYGSVTAKRVGEPDPFLEQLDEPPPIPIEQRYGSAGSKLSVGQCSEARSRVTSWTNSTVAGTVRSRMCDAHPPPANDGAGLKRSTSQSTLRKASSFFGRPVVSKLRKPSKPQLRGSEESHGLYSALQERMKPAKRTPTPEQSANESVASRSRGPSALSTLPSQQHAANSTASTHRYSTVTSTVRSVTPDPMAYKLGICSPVPEVMSPDQNEASTGGRKIPHLPTRKAPAPSQEQLNRRLQRSRNRWQSPLDELSPTRASTEDIPHELRSLSQSHHQPPVTNDLPHHAKVARSEPVDRSNMLSPSLYSRGTDGATPRPDTPVENCGMVVTITGREIRSYSISPPKRGDEAQQRPVQSSGQWRKWLSDEVLKDSQEDFTLTQAFLQNSAVESRPTSRQGAMPPHDISRPTSASPQLPESRPPSSTRTMHPRPRGPSRSSFMNDRYPMIDTGRNSSDEAVRARTRSGLSSVMGERAANSTTRPSTDSSHAKTSTLGSNFNRPRVVAGRQSLAQLETAALRSRSALGTPEEREEPKMSGAIPEPAQPDTTNPLPSSDKATLPSVQRPRITNTKHKSAFELRASYKNNNTGRSTPIEIRRRQMNDIPDHGEREDVDSGTNILEDSTILNIAAGPYALTATSAPRQTNPAASKTTPASNESNKENAAPAPSPTPSPGAAANGLPQLSSSEWLAAGPNKARRPPSMMVHPALRDRSSSRSSAPRKAKSFYGAAPENGSGVSPKTNGAKGSGTPAQRMASEWLEKRSRENTPAFV